MQLCCHNEVSLGSEMVRKYHNYSVGVGWVDDWVLLNFLFKIYLKLNGKPLMCHGYSKVLPNTFIFPITCSNLMEVIYVLLFWKHSYFLKITPRNNQIRQWCLKLWKCSIKKQKQKQKTSSIIHLLILPVKFQYCAEQTAHISLPDGRLRQIII